MRQKIALAYVRAKFKILSAFSKQIAAEKAFQLFCTPQHRNKKPLPPVFEKAETIDFVFAGHKMQGYRWNHPQKQKLLILHGFESSVINFDRYVKPLVKAGFEVLAVDAPAHGRSGGKQIDVVMYKNFIRHIQKQFGEIKNFIAHSFGGLALSLVLEETNHDETTRVVFIAPAAETSTAINSFFRLLRLGSGVRTHFDSIIAKKGGHNPEWFSMNRMATNIKAKVLWLQDKDDQMTPLSDVEPIIKKNYSNFQFLISEGLGHRRIYRDNNSHRAIIRFFDPGHAQPKPIE